MIITPLAKNLVQPQDPQKVHPLDQKLHRQVLLIDKPRKTSSMHHYVSPHAKNISLIRHVGKNIV